VGQAAPDWRLAHCDIPLMEYIVMSWSVEHTDEFGEWFHALGEAQQDDVTSIVLLLHGAGSAAAFSLFVRGERVEP
jgi:hypothetical protein